MHEIILTRFANLKKKPDNSGWIALCPAHDDHRPSLSITPRIGGFHAHCFAGCTEEEICRALNLGLSDLRGKANNANGKRDRRILETYDYHTESGSLLFQVVRTEPKGFFQRRPDGSGGWHHKLNGTLRVPYRLPELLAAPSDELVFITEGEKDADRLYSIGCIGTTNPGGAGKWHLLDEEVVRKAFTGKKVVTCADHDGPGLKHAVQVANHLHGMARSIKILGLHGWVI